MRILVIEDSDSIRRMIQALVASRGYEVQGAPNGARGIDAALSEVPDVVLLDLHLPGPFDGFDVCKKLREQKETQDVPILIISAMSDEASKERALAAGANAFYTKPFSPIALLKELEGLRTKTKESEPS